MTMTPEVKTLLTFHRDSIDRLDAALINILAERFKKTQAVGKIKAEYNLPVASLDREAEQIERFERLALEADLDPDFAKKFLRFMISEVITHHKTYKRTANKE